MKLLASQLRGSNNYKGTYKYTEIKNVVYRNFSIAIWVFFCAITKVNFAAKNNVFAKLNFN